MEFKTLIQSAEAVFTLLNVKYCLVRKDEHEITYRLRDLYVNREMIITVKKDHYRLSFLDHDAVISVPFKNNRQFIIMFTRDIVCVWKGGKR